MLEELYRENDVSVFWDETNRWIYTDWRNMPRVQSVKDGCGAMLDLMKSKKASKVLNDNTHVTGPWSAAGDWVADVWFPKMISAGLTKFAWIQSPSVLSQLAAEKSEKRTPGDIIWMCKDKAEAEAWLRDG